MPKETYAPMPGEVKGKTYPQKPKSKKTKAKKSKRKR
jgi:hypothetical protein